MHTIVSSLEILEDRIAPAGVVAVAYNAGTGELTLTGDIAANEVHVFQTGPATHRIEGVAATTLTGGVTVQDIGALTKLTILAGDGADRITLDNLTALTQLDFDAGPGDGSLSGENITVAGNVNFTGGAGSDNLDFGGLLTRITGNLTVNDAAGGDSVLSLGAQKTVIRGSVLYTGGGGSDSIDAFGVGTLKISHGVNFNSGAGGGSINLTSQAGVRIGQLPTGESIVFTGGDGSDSLRFGGKAASLAGGIRMSGGLLDDSITFNNDNGTVTIGALATGQSILFDGGGGNDEINTSATSFIAAGGIDFTTGDGTNSVTLGGANGKTAIGKLATGQSIKITGGVGDDTLTTDTTALTLAGSIDFAGGDGANSITLGSAGGAITVGQAAGGASITYTGGAGADSITTTSALLQLPGGIDFAGGAAANTVALNGPNGTARLGKLATGESVKFTGAGGADSFTTDFADFKTTGGISFAGGDGVNAINFNGDNGVVKIGRLATGQSILYTGGAGNDDMRSDNQGTVILKGGIEFAGGDGNNNVNIDNAGTVRLGAFGTGQSVKYTGGAVGDSVFFGGHTVILAGSAEMTGGDGSNTLDLDGASVSIGKNAAGDSLVLTGGGGSDQIDLQNTLTIAGSIKLDGGAGQDNLDLTQIDSLSVGGSVAFLGGADDDDFGLNAFALNIVGGVTFTGGDGADTATISADGVIRGNVILDLGAALAGDQSASLTSRTGLPTGLKVKGTLSVTGTGAAASTDAFTLANVVIVKAITASLGAGVSTVTIDNLRAGDTLTINTNDGADIIAIERGDLVERFGGNSIIASLATIQAGAGNDSVLIGYLSTAINAGVADSTRVQFRGNLIADGGADTDTRNDYAAQNDITGVPTITNFSAVLVTP